MDQEIDLIHGILVRNQRKGQLYSVVREITTVFRRGVKGGRGSVTQNSPDDWSPSCFLCSIHIQKSYMNKLFVKEGLWGH